MRKIRIPLPKKTGGKMGGGKKENNRRDRKIIKEQLKDRSREQQ